MSDPGTSLKRFQIPCGINAVDWPYRDRGFTHHHRWGDKIRIKLSWIDAWKDEELRIELLTARRSVDSDQRDHSRRGWVDGDQGISFLERLHGYFSERGCYVNVSHVSVVSRLESFR